MEVKQALVARKSVRAFLDKPVAQEIINKVLERAKTAPSATNTQPWQVAVVTGKTKDILSQKMEAAFYSGERGKMDYQYYPIEWQGVYKARRQACGLLMYSTLNIKREDKKQQADQWAANYRAFGAPVMLLFFMDKIMEKGSYIDYGMFLQSVMLAAVEEGLATCPQAALAEYPQMVKKVLGYPQESVLMCGMALGYEDENALINTYRTTRKEMNSFVKYFA